MVEAVVYQLLSTELYFNNYDFCELVKFGMILWKFNIDNTHLIKVQT